MRLIFDCWFWKRAIDRMTPTERGLFAMCIAADSTLFQAMAAVHELRKH